MLRVLPDHFTGHAAQEGASRGGFTLGFPKVWLKPAEAVFVAIACETECALWVISGH